MAHSRVTLETAEEVMGHLGRLITGTLEMNPVDTISSDAMHILVGPGNL